MNFIFNGMSNQNFINGESYVILSLSLDYEKRVLDMFAINKDKIVIHNFYINIDAFNKNWIYNNKKDNTNNKEDSIDHTMKLINMLLEETNSRIPKDKLIKEFDDFMRNNDTFNLENINLLKYRILN